MDKPWKVIVAFVGVFIAGAVFGGFFSLGMGWQVLERRAQAAAVPAPVAVVTPPAPVAAAPVAAPAAAPKKAAPAQPMAVAQSVRSAQLMRQITNRLDLLPSQRDRILPLIQRAVEDLWHNEQYRERENAYLVQRLRQDIGKQLTPAQRARSEELWEKALEKSRARQAEAQAQAKAGAAASTSSTGSTAAPGGTGATTTSSSTAPAATATTPAGETPSAQKKE